MCLSDISNVNSSSMSNLEVNSLYPLFGSHPESVSHFQMSLKLKLTYNNFISFLLNTFTSL